MTLFLEGLAAGFMAVFFVGPVLFTLLNAALDEGFVAGVLVAAGVAVSDILAIALCASALGPVLAAPAGQWWLQVVGGLILAGFGSLMAVGAGRAAPTDAPARSVGRGHFLAGFLVNFVNPFVFTFWIGAIGGVGARHGLTTGVLVPFFGGMVTTIFATDVAKAWAAGALKAHLNGAALVLARRLVGALLAVAGVALLANAAWTGAPS